MNDLTTMRLAKWAEVGKRFFSVYSRMLFAWFETGGGGLCVFDGFIAAAAKPGAIRGEKSLNLPMTLAGKICRLQGIQGAVGEHSVMVMHSFYLLLACPPHSGELQLPCPPVDASGFGSGGEEVEADA